jgi:ABC-2 type transport system ATP-binding protein
MNSGEVDAGMPPAIAVDALTRRFRDTVAVDAVSFDVKPGAICGVVGPNGAGKSTTFRMICGLLRPTSGTVRILGRDVTRDHGTVPALVGLLPETPHFYPYLSGERNLAVLAHTSGRQRPTSRVTDLLKLVGLDGERGKRIVSTYSAGMKQRLALAAALLNDPPVLLLDEPTAGLDPVGAIELRTMIKSFAEEGRTVLMATQALDEAERMCTQLIVLARGQLQANVEVSALLTSSGVRIRATPIERAVATLRALEGVQAVTMPDGVIHVETGVATTQLVRSLVLSGVDVAEVYLHRPTLEHHFLRLTDHSATHEVASQ